MYKIWQLQILTPDDDDDDDDDDISYDIRNTENTYEFGLRSLKWGGRFDEDFLLDLQIHKHCVYEGSHSNEYKFKRLKAKFHFASRSAD